LYELIINHFFSDEKFYYNIISGVVAGAVAAALCNPTDLLKVRKFCFISIGKNPISGCHLYIAHKIGIADIDIIM
jgi:type IV pilus biogenesis protein CpaD/CtpE